MKRFVFWVVVMGLLNFSALAGNEQASVKKRTTMESLRRPIEENPIYQAAGKRDSDELYRVTMSATQAERDEYNRWMEEFLTMSGADKRLKQK